IGIEHGNGGLDQDGAGIEKFVDNMNGTAGNPHPMIEGLALGVESRERREQGRVNVQYAVGKGLYERRAEQPHEAGEADELHIVSAQLIDYELVVSFALHAARFND